MDSRITIGDKLELVKIETILSVNPDREQKIYVSQVLDESQNGEYLVSTPIQEGKVVPLSVGQEFYATFYSKSGLLRCSVEITGRYKQGQLFFMEITQTTALEKIQRREYFRFSYNCPIRYRIISDKERELIEKGIAYKEDEMEIVWKNGVILDLSGGGIHFVSSVHEEKNSLVQVCFEIMEGSKKEMIYAFADLLRSEKNQNNSGVYNNHVMFWRMGKNMREKIIRFIFDAQRRERSKENGLE